MGAGYTSQKVKQLGNESFMAGDYLKAEEYYNIILKHDKSNYLVLANRCLCHIKTDKLGFAYQDAQAAIALKPDLGKIHYRLSMVYERLGMTYDALLALRRASALEPGSQEVLNKMKEIQEKVSKEHQIKGRQAILSWGKNDTGACGVPK